jgi:glycine cleavage system H protein
MKYYSEDHEWIEVKGRIATVGISDHAAEELGDITYVELPLEGDDVIVGDTIGVVESVKAAADVYCPISGTVAAVNDALDDHPELINKSAESDGWIYKIKKFDEDDLEGLMNIDQYFKFLKESK